MANDSKTLEDRLIELGNSLASLPSSVDQLYSLLEKIDSLLSNVEQSPSQSILSALKPIMKVLPVKELLRHPDMDVKAAVASCLSEITRITAPEAPFDDDIMKEIFQMIVGAFGMLGDMSSRAFEKRVSVLETVAKVRFCVVMLDLECDALILEMFHHFVKVIRPEHPENVPTSMETIMSLVIEESEDISQEILSCLLDTAKDDNQDVLPIARDLVKKVMGKCLFKLKPSFLELVQSAGAPLSKYIDVVASMYEEDDDSKVLGHNEPNEPHGPDENMAEDNKVLQAEDNQDRAVSDVLPQVSGKLEQEVGCTEKNDTAADISTAAVTIHVNSQMGNGDSMEQPSSPEQNSDESCRHEQPSVVNEQIDNDNSELTAVKLDCLTELKDTDPPVQLTDTPDHSRVDSDKDAPPLSKDAGSLQLDDATANVVEPAISLEPEKKNELEHVLEPDNPAAVESPVATESPVNSVRTKRGRPPSSKVKVAEKQTKVEAAEEPASASGEKDLLPNSKVVVTEDNDSMKEPEVTDRDVAPTSVANDSEVKPNDSEVKPQRNSVKKRGLKRKNIWKDSSGRKRKSRLKQQKEANSLGKEAAGEPSLEGVESSPRSASDVPGIDDTHQEDTSKIKSSKKSSAELDDISEIHDSKEELGENLVGSKIRVWWPDDAEFYDGMVDSYDRKNKKHRIVYIDGDVEDLVLKDEQWEFVESSIKKKEGKQKDQGNASQNSRTKREKSTSDALSKQEKLQTQLKSGMESSTKDAGRRKGGARTGISTVGKLSYDDSPSTSKKAKGKPGKNIKVKTPKSRGKNEDVPEIESEEDTPETNGGKEEEPGKSKDETDEFDGKTKNETPKTGSKSRHRKKSNKKGTRNSSSIKDDTPLKGFLTRKSKESTPKTASRVEEDNLVAKNRKTKTSGGSGANGISSGKGKGKAKAGESESITGVDEGEVKTGGTGGKKRKRKSGRK